MSRTVGETYRDGVERLRAVGVDSPEQDARRLMLHLIGVGAGLGPYLSQELNAESYAKWEAMLSARTARQPVSQIIGFREFWCREYKVTPDVLDPRPETETLIEAALAHPARRILDLGTGSGIIALTLAAEWPQAQVLASDISDEALAVAQENATRLNLGSRVKFIRSDWFAGVPDQRFDLIVSNPPYIAEAEMPGLLPELREWEPQQALTPGGDGLHAYRKIASTVISYLAPAGRLCLEIGATQAAEVSDLLEQGGLQDIAVIRDLSQKDRVVCAYAPRSE